MLKLTRRAGETIRIGDDITVTILSAHKRGRAGPELGINAPRTVEIHREEVYNRIQREKAQAKKRERRLSLSLGGRGSRTD